MKIERYMASNETIVVTVKRISLTDTPNAMSPKAPTNNHV